MVRSSISSTYSSARLPIFRLAAPSPAIFATCAAPLYGLPAILRLHFDLEEQLYLTLQEGWHVSGTSSENRTMGSDLSQQGTFCPGGSWPT